MIEKYAILKEKKIIKVFVTADGMHGVAMSLANEKITDFDKIEMIGIDHEWKRGYHTDEYDDKGVIKTDVERMILGRLDVPKGMKLIDDKLVEKTTEEKVRDGVIKLSDYEKLDSATKEIRQKTEAELISDGVLTQEQVDQQKLEIEIQAELRLMAIERINART